MSQGEVKFSGEVEIKHMARVLPPEPVKQTLKQKFIHWKIHTGCTWRGRKPDNWKPQPTTRLARLYCFIWRPR